MKNILNLTLRYITFGVLMGGMFGVLFGLFSDPRLWSFESSSTLMIVIFVAESIVIPGAIVFLFLRGLYKTFSEKRFGLGLTALLVSMVVFLVLSNATSQTVNSETVLSATFVVAIAFLLIGVSAPLMIMFLYQASATGLDRLILVPEEED